MTVAVAPVTGSLLVSFEYDATGLAWVIAHDNTVLAWLVDETGTEAPSPVILGSLPATPVDTSPVLSPVWGVREGIAWFVPDTVRGGTAEMLTFIATNNGANRPIYASFADTMLATEWQQWAANNPSLVLTQPPQ